MKFTSLLPVLALSVSLLGCQATTGSGLRAYKAGNTERAVTIWEPLAVAGDADAQYLMGLALDQPGASTATASMAARWYRLAGEQ
ncbi:MAG: tetratricopeptide repeat protein, partial [Planctomycetota bacterium]